MPNLVAALCFLPMLLSAADKPKDPSAYTIAVDVTASQYVSSGLTIYANLDGAPVQFTSDPLGYLLVPGEYFARIASAGDKIPSYGVKQRYELMFPDGKTATVELSCIGLQCRAR